MLTQDRLMELLEYNPCTGLFTWKVCLTWRKPIGSSAGSIKPRGYISIAIDGKRYYAHRLAWLFVHGEFPDKSIDHIDRNPSNNRIDNLRQCSQSENCQNYPIKSSNSSGTAGVHYSNRDKKWIAKIRVGGKRITIGNFSTLEEAATARIDAKEKLHTFNPSNS